MLMMDRNNREVAEVIQRWLEGKDLYRGAGRAQRGLPNLTVEFKLWLSMSFGAQVSTRGMSAAAATSAQRKPPALQNIHAGPNRMDLVGQQRAWIDGHALGIFLVGDADADCDITPAEMQAKLLLV